MKFRHSSPTRAPLFILFACICVRTVHAKYDVPELTAHLKQKTKNIQAEYQKLRKEETLRYLWDTCEHPSRNLIFDFLGEPVASTEDMKYRTELFFSSAEPHESKRLQAFACIFASENFLRMLFGDAVVNKLVDCEPNKFAFFWWEEEVFEKPSKVRTFSLRIRQMVHEQIGFNCENVNTFLDITLVFAYDFEEDTVQFIGLKGVPSINVRYVTDTGLPIYYSRSNSDFRRQRCLRYDD